MYLTDFQFSRDFRCKRTTAEKLVLDMGGLFPDGVGRNGVAIHPRERILHFLHFLGTNNLYRDDKVIRKMLHIFD